MIRRPPRSTRTDTLFPYTTLFRSSLVSTFKGLPHRLHVADALEGVVGAAAGQLDQMRHQVALDVLWVHEVGHAELGRKLLAGRVQVDADDHVGSDHAGALHHVEADADRKSTRLNSSH